MDDNNDYYEILGIDKFASHEDIKKAYKKLALKWHPDRNNGSEESLEMFKKISKAYEILSNEDSKMKYDNGDSEEEENEIDAFTMFASTFGDFFKMHGIGIHNFNIDDFVDNSDDVIVDCINYVEVSIEDLYNGATISQQFERYSECEKCNGFGTKNAKLANCKKCKGSGQVPLKVGHSTIPTVCNSCEGSCIEKSVPKCSECIGAKFAPETVEVDLDIIPGSRDGTKIVVHGEGNAVPPEEVKKYGIERSNAIFIIKEKPHDKFKRGLIIPGKTRLDFADLMVELKITFEESLIGFTKNIPHPSGKQIKITVNESCIHGDTLVVEGYGMPHENNQKSKGDFFIKLLVERPVISPDVKKNLSKIFGYSHVPSKNSVKHMTLDTYKEKFKSTTNQTEKQEKKPLKKSQIILESSEEKTETKKKSRGRPSKNSKKQSNLNEDNMDYPTDSDDDYGLTVFHNAHEKHRPHILTKQPYNMTPDELKNYQIFDNQNDDSNMKAMEVFKNFPGMQQMMNMNFDSDDECIPFKSNGKGTYTSTIVHPDGHTTTTTTKTFVNGEEMDLSNIPGLDPDFLAGIPELENIPGLRGLFGIGKKKNN